MNIRNKSHLTIGESLFVSGPLSRFKELLFTFKVQFSFINAFKKCTL